MREAREMCRHNECIFMRNTPNIIFIPDKGWGAGAVGWKSDWKGV